LDPLQTNLVCREDSEIGHSEKVARVLQAAGGGADLGGERETWASSRIGEMVTRIGSLREEIIRIGNWREEEEGWGQKSAHSRDDEE
jgi:hypothetical protein